MKVAVTGATGFIGRHVLSQLGMSSINFSVINTSQIPKTLEHSECEIVHLDLHNPPSNILFSWATQMWLFILLGRGLPNYKSLHHFETELPAQYQFLRSLITSKLRNLVVAGTCAEYGMQPGMLSENIEPHPCNSYGFAKNTLRLQLEHLKDVYPFNLT